MRRLASVTQLYPVPPSPAANVSGSRPEYFCLQGEGSDARVEGPFPSEKAAEDAIEEWCEDGEWTIVTKVKRVYKHTKGTTQ